MSDKEPARVPHVFLTTQEASQYTTLRCKTCNQPWIFNKNLDIFPLPNEWECPHCRRGYFKTMGGEIV